MALNSTEESQVRDLLAKYAALLTLANEEPAISSKLGATKVSLADLPAASSIADVDLMLIRQGGVDKRATVGLQPGSVLKTQLANTTTAGLGANLVGFSPTRTAMAGTVEKVLQDWTTYAKGEYLLTAVGDDTTDNTAIFQSIADSNGGKRWLLRPGIYRSGTVTLANGAKFVLQGTGRDFSTSDAYAADATVVIRSTANGPWLYRPSTTATAFYSLKGLTVFGPSTSSTLNTSAVAIRDLGHLVHGRIEDCFFGYFHGGDTGAVIELNQAFETYFARVLFQYNQGSACIKVAGGTGNWWEQIDCEGNFGGGLILGGDGTMVRPYMEYNCQRNATSGDNKTYREMLFTGGGVWTVQGAKIAAHPTNNKFPIEIVHSCPRFYDCPTPSFTSAQLITQVAGGLDARCSLTHCYGWTSDTPTRVKRDSVGYPGLEESDVVLDGISLKTLTAKAQGRYDVTALGITQSANVTSIARVSGSPNGAFRVTLPTGTISAGAAMMPIVGCDSPTVLTIRCGNFTATTFDVFFNNPGSTSLADPYSFWFALHGN